MTNYHDYMRFSGIVWRLIYRSDYSTRLGYEVWHWSWKDGAAAWDCKYHTTSTNVNQIMKTSAAEENWHMVKRVSIRLIVLITLAGEGLITKNTINP